MDIKSILQKYSRYYDILLILGKVSLEQKPSIKELKIKRALLGTIYTEKAVISDNLTVIDYLCWISTQFILFNLQYTNDIKAACKTHKEDCQNMLRLFWTNPQYILNDEKIENPRKVYDIITDIRYQQFLTEKKEVNNGKGQESGNEKN